MSQSQLSQLQFARHQALEQVAQSVADIQSLEAQIDKVKQRGSVALDNVRGLTEQLRQLQAQEAQANQPQPNPETET